jgi:hypothetical protein
MRNNATWLNAALSKIAHPEPKPAACPGNPEIARALRIGWTSVYQVLEAGPLMGGVGS